MRWPGPDVGSVAFPASDARSVSFPGADSEIVAFPPAPMLVIPIDAAVSGIGTVAATLVTTPVYPMDVTGLGTASAAVTASSVIPAGVTGEGEALAVFAQLIEAPVSGVGTASVVVQPSITLAAGATGSGTVSTTVIPAATIVAAASCEGIPGVDAWPAAIVSIAATGSGTAIAGLTARTPINASASGEGSATATVSAVTIRPSGILKSGTQSTPNSSTRSQITGWVADPAYPGSMVSGDGLAVTGTRLVNVAAQITYTEAGQSFTANVLEIRNQSGTVLATGGATGSNRVQTVSATNVSVSTGDVLSLWASRGRSSTVEAAGTYLNFTW